MRIKELTLYHFKNFAHWHSVFDRQVNVLVGPNGKGKTNILDAIYMLAMGRSYFSLTNRQLIRHGEDFFSVRGMFEKDDSEMDVLLKYRRGERKILSVNGKDIERLSDHIGRIPVVMISPYDRDLIGEGAETRRRFIDKLISQYDAAYLADLIRYHRTLQQRNSLLKFFAANGVYEEERLEPFDLALSETGTRIFEKRKAFAEKISPLLRQKYAWISGDAEQVDLRYRSALHQSDLLSLLRANREKDRVLQYTRFGIHRDDLEFLINGYPIRKFGSQGQQKSFLVALRLAQSDLLYHQKNDTPILLFDDAFDKLDPQRVEQILLYVKNQTAGQVFITDTHDDRIRHLLEVLENHGKIIALP